MITYPAFYGSCLVCWMTVDLTSARKQEKRDAIILFIITGYVFTEMSCEMLCKI